VGFTIRGARVRFFTAFSTFALPVPTSSTAVIGAQGRTFPGVTDFVAANGTIGGAGLQALNPVLTAQGRHADSVSAQTAVFGTELRTLHSFRTEGVTGSVSAHLLATVSRTPTTGLSTDKLTDTVTTRGTKTLTRNFRFTAGITADFLAIGISDYLKACQVELGEILFDEFHSTAAAADCAEE
jgi:hypothetical protein